MSKLIKLFQPGKIGKMELKNRLIMSPMGTFTYDSEGFLMDQTTDFYVERAKGGVGFIIAQSADCLREGRSQREPGIWDDKFIPGLKKIADTVHKYDCKIAWQVVYYGKLLSRLLDVIPHPEEIKVIGPSAIPWVRNNIAPKEATKDDIKLLVEAFSEGARRIKDAGFDAVEIHGAHGYALTQWLSPRDNRRTDEYGGSPERRARMLCDILHRTREKVGPDFPISLRVSGSDFLEGGIKIEDTVLQAPLFVEAGADVLNISAGEAETNHWEKPPYLFPDGAIVHLAEAVKKVVDIPVITVGKIWDPFFAEQILQEGKADFVAMGRALLADPELPNKAREGRFQDIRRCIYCNNCMARISAKVSQKVIMPNSLKAVTWTSCTINPAAMREKDFLIKPSISPKEVMVIGGGIAGMEAARVLAQRGHRVSLYEKNDKLGGQWNIASEQPHKEAFATLTDYQIRGLKESGVRVILNKEVTRQLVEEAKPDVVVLATGATPATLNVPGGHYRNVAQAIDVIRGKAKVGRRVVVIGGRHRGMEMSVSLAEQGKKVFLVTRRRLGRDVEQQLYRTLRDRLIEHGVSLFANSPVNEIRENGVYIVYNQELTFLKADTVVLAVGAKPENKLVKELQGVVSELYAIGDCVQPRDAMDAVREGAEIGRKI